MRELMSTHSLAQAGEALFQFTPGEPLFLQIRLTAC